MLSFPTRASAQLGLHPAWSHTKLMSQHGCRGHVPLPNSTSWHEARFPTLQSPGGERIWGSASTGHLSDERKERKATISCANDLSPADEVRQLQGRWMAKGECHPHSQHKTLGLAAADGWVSPKGQGAEIQLWVVRFGWWRNRTG